MTFLRDLRPAGHVCLTICSQARQRRLITRGSFDELNPGSFQDPAFDRIIRPGTVVVSRTRCGMSRVQNLCQRINSHGAATA